MTALVEDLATNFFRRQILASSFNKGNYDYHLDSHLNRLISIDLSDFRGSKIDFRRRSKFNFDRYVSLTQSAFEKSEFYENHSAESINWEITENILEKIDNQLKIQLGNEVNTPEFIKIKNYSLNSIRYDLIYSQLYPKSISNPWKPTSNIYLRSGLLFEFTDNLDYLKEFIHGTTKKSIETYKGNLGIIVKMNGIGKRSINGFVIDDKYKIQLMVFDFLRKNAFGHRHKKTQAEIAKFLKVNEVEPRYVNQIQENILVALKKTGFIGSTGKGFFFISNKEDLLLSCEFHRTKILSMNRIINKYQQRQSELNIDLDKECLNKEKKESLY